LTRIDVNRKQFGSALVSLSTALTRAIENTSEFAESRLVTFAMPSADWGLVFGDEELLIRAFQALLETAVKFSNEGKTVRLAHEVVLDSAAVIIESHGRTIPITAIPIFLRSFLSKKR
jgi:K+-sensing histidine kinase KdpD